MPVLTVGNVANKCILYQKFAEGGVEVAGIPALWTETGKAELIALKGMCPLLCATPCTGGLRYSRRRKWSKRTRR